MDEFRWPVRVYWEDTDAGGVVYHAAYLRFMERARTEWLRAHSLDQSRLAETPGVVFVVRGMEVKFRSPARLDDALDVSVRLERLRRASLEIAQTVARGQERIVEARVHVACVDAARFKPVAIPHLILESLDHE